MNERLFIFGEVFRRPIYFFLALLSAFVFYEINVLIKNYAAIISLTEISWSLTLKFIYTLSIGFHESVTAGSFLMLLIISILFGILLSMIVFKIRLNIPSGKTGFVAGFGIALGVLAPGCAACGIGILSFIGLGGATLSLFPLGGLEISIIAAILMLFSIYHLSQSLLKCEPCKIKTDERRK